MFKRIFTVSLLSALLLGINIFPQTSSMEVSPNLEQVKQTQTPIEATWDVEFNYDAATVTLLGGSTGAVYIPSLNKFWTSRWATALAHQWNMDGTLDMEFTLPFTGTRNMVFDGTFIYCCNSTTTVQIVDPVTRTVVGTVSVVGAPNGFRSMTYNPDGDGGNGSLIGGNWTAPNLNFYEFSMTGVLLRTIPSTVTGVYGIAYDKWSAGGPFLWVWGQGLGAGTPQIIQQMDFNTGTYTGVQHDVMTDVGVGQPTTTGIAGGMFITDQLIPGEATMGGVLQGTPNSFFGYELTTTNAPPVFFDNFDAYTAGNLVACSNPTAWTTWSNAPCGAEDAEVSSAFAYSGTNSAKVIFNDDLVKDFGTAFTTGKYKMSFQAYIPAGKAGYFNTLATFAGSNSSWGLDVYFNTTGVCSVFAGSATAIVSATYPPATWFLVEHIVDLDANLSELIINGTSVHTWQWTLGSIGSGCPLTLDANDFFGATANDEMYFDDYSLELLSVVPVELTSFSANVNNGNVILNWTTATELNNQGFEVERKIADGQFITIGHVQGNGTTTERKEYSFTDANAQIGNYTYRLKQVDFNGAFEYSNEIFVDVTAPLEFALDQNYPNPFNPTTTINFSLAEPSFVKLAVYNLLGEEVKVLVSENRGAGSFNVTLDASSLPSGMYLYKIETAQYSSVKKMMLMK
ncbi:MAG: T9SS type A sorting domain-containing protein [Ignavibacteriales bacterium]|nr:T9SS type A sorting domain-containing protein [Ignavibacteriales bacterium]